MLPSNSKTPLSAKYKLQWDRDQSCRRRSIMMRSTHYTDGNECVPSRRRSLPLTSGSSFLVVADSFLTKQLFLQRAELFWTVRTLILYWRSHDSQIYKSIWLSFQGRVSSQRTNKYLDDDVLIPQNDRGLFQQQLDFVLRAFCRSGLDKFK